MRSILVSIAMAVLFCGAAEAASCTKPGKPALPNGTSSNVGEMEKAEKTVGTYLDQVRAFVECRQKEVEDIQADIKKSVDEADTVKNAWNGEVDKFNSK